MYQLYVLKCGDNSLYTGITNDLDSRLKAHCNGEGSKYVRSHLPFKLVYVEDHENRSAASKREFEIKSWSRKKKIERLGLEI